MRGWLTVVAALSVWGAFASGPVVFLHGWNSDGGIWGDMKSLLKKSAGYESDDFRAYSYYDMKDAEGRRIDLDTPIEEIARAVAARLDEDFPDGTFDVVAHSMGGLVLRSALAQGLLAPERVGRFITLGTPHYGEYIGVPGFSAGTQTHQMALGSAFLWDLAYDWHFRGRRVPRTLCIAGAVGKDLTGGLWGDGLVPAFSAVLGDAPCLYVKRYHSDVFELFGKVVYACEDGAKDPVYRAVEAFLTEDRVLTQEDIGWSPNSDVTKRGALFYRISDTAGGEAFAYDRDEPSVAGYFVSAFTGKRHECAAYYHGGKGSYGAPLGLEMTAPSLATAVYDARLKTPDGEGFTVQGVTVVGGRVNVVEFGADGTLLGNGYYPAPEPPKEYAFWKKTTSVTLVYGDDVGYAGTASVKVGKISKKGTVKVAAAFTPFGGKKRTAKTVTCEVADDGSLTAAWAEVKGIGAVTLDIAPTEGGADVSGAIGEFDVSSAAVGGDWPASFAAVVVGFDAADLPEGTLADLLPADETAAATARKWTFAKAAKVKFAKVKGSSPAEYALVVDDAKGKTNLSAMKLVYTAKTGVFKGSFRIYAVVESKGRPKLRKHSVNVTGCVVDGTGYGAATLKATAATWPVRVEAR